MFNIIIGLLMFSFCGFGIMSGIFYLFFRVELFYNFMIYAFIISGISAVIFFGIIFYINSKYPIKDNMTDQQ